jgi:hypothetical protein
VIALRWPPNINYSGSGETCGSILWCRRSASVKVDTTARAAPAIAAITPLRLTRRAAFLRPADLLLVPALRFFRSVADFFFFLEAEFVLRVFLAIDNSRFKLTDQA